eukprot:scaffold38010_cov34-Tisochrysis_lutea.AAC.3
MMLIDARSVRVRRVHQLARDAQGDGVLDRTPKVLAPPVTFARPPVACSAHVNTLDEDKPSTALIQHVISNTCGPLVPVRPWIVLCPCRFVRLVHQVGGHDIPLATKRLCKPAPAVLRGSLIEGAVLLIPEPVARKGVSRETVARKDYKDVVLGCRVCNGLEHLQVPHWSAGMHIDELRIENGAERGQRDKAILADSFVIEGKSQGIEVVLREEVEVEVHGSSIEPLRDNVLALWSKPSSTLTWQRARRCSV